MRMLIGLVKNVLYLIVKRAQRDYVLNAELVINFRRMELLVFNTYARMTLYLMDFPVHVLLELIFLTTLVYLAHNKTVNGVMQMDVFNVYLDIINLQDHAWLAFQIAWNVKLH